MTVNEYIDKLKSDLKEYSTLLFDSEEECLMADVKYRKKAIVKALKKGDSKYTDDYLKKELDFTEQVIKELQRRVKETKNMKNKNKLNEAIDGSIFDEREQKIFNDLKNQKEEESILDLIQDRIGQDMTLGELNTVLQSIFGKYDDIFLLHNDLYNADIDEPQDLVIWDDNDMYTITFNIKDIEEAIIEITDVNVE